MLIGYDIRAIIGKPLFGTQEPTGVPWYVIRLLKELVMQGTDREFILFANAFKKPELALIEDILQQPHVSLVTSRIPNKIFDNTAYFLNQPHIDQIIKRKTGKDIDIYFTPHLNITPLSKHVRYALTMHDLTFELYPSFFPFRKQYWHIIQNARRACDRADVIFAVSKHTKQDLLTQYRIDPKKVHAIHQGVVLDTQTDVSFETLLKKYNFSPKYMLCVGTLEPRKNIEGIIEAFTIYKQNTHDTAMQLVLAGGDGWLYTHIYETAKRSPYKKDIHFLGYVSEQDKATLMKHAKVFVFPSFYEGVGVPVLEALAQGTPVVTSHVSSLPEVTQHNAVLVDPYNTYDIAQGMVFAQQMKASNNYHTSEFDWEKTGKQVLENLEVLISKP